MYLDGTPHQVSAVGDVVSRFDNRDRACEVPDACKGFKRSQPMPNLPLVGC